MRSVIVFLALALASCGKHCDSTFTLRGTSLDCAVQRAELDAAAKEVTPETP